MYQCHSYIKCYVYFTAGSEARLLESLVNRTIPLWWDDIDSLVVLEKLTVLLYNKVTERPMYIYIYIYIYIYTYMSMGKIFLLSFICYLLFTVIIGLRTSHTSGEFYQNS